jgi:2-oxoglutarate ferredoxin oxidoreductase subunit beta
MKTPARRLAEKVQSIQESNVFDIRSGELPTWCPGCGYFGIHFGINNALQRLGLDHHQVVIVSGIGCAGRYPFFSNTYGHHTVHGRSLPVAQGVKLGNPNLTVLAVGGDGDGLGIGGGHFPHAARRNFDINYVLFDNSIYGLTKGQPSPSTPKGFKTKASPEGTVDQPLNATLLALSYGATFVARLFAGDPEGITTALMAGIRHKGFSFFHVYTSCVTFDKQFKTWNNLTNRVRPLPADYDPADRRRAIERVLVDDDSLGIFYQEPPKGKE